MSQFESAELQNSATDESTETKPTWKQSEIDTTGDIERLDYKVPSRSLIDKIKENARFEALNDEETVEWNTDLMEPNPLALGSIIFGASVDHYGFTDDDYDTVSVLLSDEMRFEGMGDGWLVVDVRADAETGSIHSVTVQTDLTAETKRQLTDGRPDDCDCWPNADIPCWPCYRDGFEESVSAD